MGSRLVIEFTRLDDLLVDVELVSCAGKHALLDTLLSDEPKNPHNLGLANTVGTILRLLKHHQHKYLRGVGWSAYKICMGIPVAVIENNRICGLEVQTQTTSTS